MATISAPPMAPGVESQMAANQNFGAGVGQAQSQMGKNPIELAVGTVEKILTGISDESFRPYAMKAIATLKVGMAVATQKQPQSAGMGAPPQASGPQIPMPPTPGQMPA